MIRKLLTCLLTFVALQAFAAVDVNRADRAELESIKGIGPGLSAKILDARKTGSFKNWADMVERISGVGPGNAARLSQAGLTVGGSTFDATTVAAAPAKGKKVAKAEK
jgi:competence protein ComEA